MSSTESQELRQLCKTQGLLAAVLLLQPEPRVWLGGLNQSDYAQLLLLSQTQSLPILLPGGCGSTVFKQAVLVHSQVLRNKSLALLVFPSRRGLKSWTKRRLLFWMQSKLGSAKHGRKPCWMASGRARLNQLVQIMRTSWLSFRVCLRQTHPAKPPNPSMSRHSQFRFLRSLWTPGNKSFK